MNNYILVISILIFGIGFLSMLLHKNLLRKIIGINIMSTSVFLFLTAQGYIQGGKAPMLLQGVELYINPIPSGLVLTGIVVGVSSTAFALALCLKIFKEYGTLDVDQLALLHQEQEESL